MFMSMLLTIMFYGLMNWSVYFIIIYLFQMIFLIMIPGVLPRIRYDELMKMCWTELLLLILLYLFFIHLFKELILIIF